MRIVPNSFAIFWTNGRLTRQFHADLCGYDIAQNAVDAFRTMFPDDVVCSVRDASGRFVSFN